MQHLSDVSSLKQASLGWCTGLMSLDPDWCFLYSSKETFPPHFGNGWGVAFCQPCMIPGGTMGGFLTTKKDSWATENCLWLACLASDKLGWNQVSFKRCYTKVPLHLYNATKKKTSSRFFFFFHIALRKYRDLMCLSIRDRWDRSPSGTFPFYGKARRDGWWWWYNFSIR